MSADPWVWLAAILSLAVLSYLVADSVAYRIAEHLLVGMAAGYMLVLTWNDVLKPQLVQPLATGSDPLAIAPLVLCLVLFLRLAPASWGAEASKISVAFLVAVSAGVNISTQLQARVLSQAAATMRFDPSAGWVDLIGQGILILGTITGLAYFFFSREHKGALGLSARTGAVILMTGFGAAFGYTVMSRVAILIGRVIFLCRDWLGIL